jgi:hypothetical protein
MSNFQFWNKNHVQTTTDVQLSSGSTTASSLIDRNPTLKYSSSNQISSGTVATVTITWVAPSATIVSGIMLQNHNFENFSIYYNSNTANQFSPPLSITSNTLSNTYYSFASQSVNSIGINIETTIGTEAEKFLGQLIITTKDIELDTNPDYSTYAPVKYKKGVEFELSDGGVKSVFFAQKFRANIGLQLIESSTYHSLTGLYNEQTDFVFIPFAADTFTTNWDGQAWPVIWTGDLNIESFRSNVLANGYTGNITLQEIPN